MNVKSRHYHHGNAPKLEEVNHFLKAVKKRAKKKGSKFYKKHRELASKRIKLLAGKYNISGTITSSYWKLKGLCILLGKENY